MAHSLDSKTLEARRGADHHQVAYLELHVVQDLPTLQVQAHRVVCLFRPFRSLKRDEESAEKPREGLETCAQQPKIEVNGAKMMRNAP